MFVIVGFSFIKFTKLELKVTKNFQYGFVKFDLSLR